MDDVAIEELKALLELVDSQCMSKNKLECKKDIVEKLCSHLIVIAKAEEVKQLYDEAMEDYKYILELSSCYNDAKERLFICKLKKEKTFFQKTKNKFQIYYLRIKTNLINVIWHSDGVFILFRKGIWKR